MKRPGAPGYAGPLIVLVVAGMLMLFAVILAFLLVGGDERDAQDMCAARHAEVVRTGHGHYLCITSDGKVVGHR